MYRSVAVAAALMCGVFSSVAQAGELEEVNEFLGKSEFGKLATKTVKQEGPGVFRVDLGKPSLALWVVKQGSWVGVLHFVEASGFSLTSFMPESVVGKVKTDSAFLIIGSSGGTLQAKGLPEPLKRAVSGFREGVDFAQGINVFAQFRAGDDGVIGQMKNGGLLPETAVWLSGTVGQGLADAMFGQAGAGAAADFSLQLATGPLTPAPFATMAAPKLTLGASVYSFSRQGSTLTISGEQKNSTFALPGRSFSIPSTKLTFAPDTSSGSFTITVEGKSGKDTKWKNAFGLNGVDLNYITLSGTVSRTVSGAGASKKSVGGFSIEIGANVSVGNKTLDGSFSAAVSGSSVTDLSLNFSSDLDLGFTKLPNAKEFVFKSFAFGINPSSGTGYIGGELSWKELTGGAVFIAAPEPALFLKVEGLNLAKLMNTDVVKAPPLNALVVLGKAQGAEQLVSELPVPVQEMVKAIAGVEQSSVPLASGLSVLMKADAAALGAEPLGLSGPLVLGGEIDVVKQRFGLRAKLARMPAIKGMPEGFKADAPFFSFALSRRDSTPILEVGIGMQLKVPVGSDILSLQGTSTVSTAGTFAFTGALTSNWNEPLGLDKVIIKASPAAPLMVTIGVSADLSVDLGFQGAGVIGKQDIGPIAFCVNIQAAVPPVPKKFAFNFQASEFGPSSEVQLVQSLVHSAVDGPLKNGIDDPGVRAMIVTATKGIDSFDNSVKAMPIGKLKFTNVQAYLATPGITCAVPAIDGMGIKLTGNATFMNKPIGRIDSYVNMKDGLKIYADIQPINFLDMIEINKAKLDVLVPFPTGAEIEPTAKILKLRKKAKSLKKNPFKQAEYQETLEKLKKAENSKPTYAGHFFLVGDARVLTFSGKIDIAMSERGASFEMAAALADLGSVEMWARTEGKSLAQAKDFQIGLRASDDLDDRLLKKLGATLKATAAARKQATQDNKAAGAEAQKKANEDFEALDATIGKKLREADEEIASSNRKFKRAQNKLEDAKDDCEDALGDISFLCDAVDVAQDAVKVARNNRNEARAALNALNKTQSAANYAAAKATRDAIALEQKAFGNIMAGWNSLDQVAGLLVQAGKSDLVQIDEVTLDGSLVQASGSLSIEMMVGDAPISEEFEMNLKSPAPIDLVPLANKIADEFRRQATTEGTKVWKATHKK